MGYDWKGSMGGWAGVDYPVGSDYWIGHSAWDKQTFNEHFHMLKRTSISKVHSSSSYALILFHLISHSGHNPTKS